MSKYICCQGYLNCCCFKAGECCEESCPDCCLCLEALLCNSCAVSASRLYVMDKYQLSSDPCDYRIIRFSNCLQCLACKLTAFLLHIALCYNHFMSCIVVGICDILAIFIEELRQIACFLDRLADLVYHIVSGCMTAQVIKLVLYAHVTHRHT